MQNRGCKTKPREYGWTSATILVQVEDTVTFGVLNDSRMCEAESRHWLRKLGRLSIIQTRGALAKLAYTNMLILDRPLYRTEIGVAGRLRVPTAAANTRVPSTDRSSTAPGAA